MFFKVSKQKGYTIIELLVVISIIGFLASVVLASLNTARTKARDAKRRTDLRQLATVLELYYDVNSKYPSTVDAGGNGHFYGNCSDFNENGTIGPNDWIPGLVPTYVSRLPLDPKPAEPDRCYLYVSFDGGVNYKIIARGTVETLCTVFYHSDDYGDFWSIPSSDPMYDPGGDSCNFAVFTPGAWDW